MYVSSVHLKNICGIRELKFQVSTTETSQSATVLIGKNATGKSSVLRAIALGLASSTEANALLAEPFGSPFVHVDADEAFIDLGVIDQFGCSRQRQKTIIRDDRDNELLTSEPSDGQDGQYPMVVALGAGRSNEGGEMSRIRYTIVDSAFMLFNYEGTFIQPELTLRRLQDFVGTTQYEVITDRIRSALHLRDDDVVEFQRGGGVLVSGPYREKPIPLHSWADGYRITLNWILDIYAWAMRFKDAIDESGHVHGVLLIDEIEQHLHPSMQRRIVTDLKGIFPHLQIIATSHSPLVVQDLQMDEIVSLHRKGSMVTAAPLRDYSSFSVEDILTAEELFETPPYSIEIENARQRYRELMMKTESSPQDTKELRKLGSQLAALRIVSSRHDEYESLRRLEARLNELENDTD